MAPAPPCCPHTPQNRFHLIIAVFALSDKPFALAHGNECLVRPSCDRVRNSGYAGCLVRPSCDQCTEFWLCRFPGETHVRLLDIKTISPWPIDQTMWRCVRQCQLHQNKTDHFAQPAGLLAGRPAAERSAPTRKIGYAATR